MKIVVTGTGKSGSWKIRGDQLGAAIGARVEPRCIDFSHCDLVVYVKRMKLDALGAIRRSKVRWVWDVVDAWPQPEGNLWNADQAISWLRVELNRLRPHAVVFATDAMREDSGWRGPALVLPHHAWPRYSKRNELRPEVKTVGYEGHDYLGSWAKKLREACAQRGWKFEINGDMRHADIGVALREADGWAARRWKSNVKLANIHALGIPALCSPEAGYMQFARGTEIFLDNGGNLPAALDLCAGRAFREHAQSAEIINLKDVAEEYKTWLMELNS